MTGGARPSGDPRGNRYLVLPEHPIESFLESDPVWRLPQTPGHAVEFWFRDAAGRHASLVGLLPPPEANPIGQQDHYLHSLLVELTTSEPQTLHKPGSIRLLLRPPSDPLRVTNVFSARAYEPGRWHHVVAQRRGDSAELYLDGVPTEAPLLNPDPTPAPCRIVVGRRMPDPGDRNESRAFVGGLDELCSTTARSRRGGPPALAGRRARGRPASPRTRREPRFPRTPLAIPRGDPCDDAPSR